MITFYLCQNCFARLFISNIFIFYYFGDENFSQKLGMISKFILNQRIYSKFSPASSYGLKILASNFDFFVQLIQSYTYIIGMLASIYHFEYRRTAFRFKSNSPSRFEKIKRSNIPITFLSCIFSRSLKVFSLKLIVKDVLQFSDTKYRANGKKIRCPKLKSIFN